MNNVLSITSKATEQIKKIMSNAPNGMDSVVIGVDKSGCSGYAYKLDFGNSSDFKNFEITLVKTKQRFNTPLWDMNVELTKIEDRAS